MAVVTGTLTDFSLQALAPYSPRVKFTPSRPSSAGNRLLSARPILVDVASDGSFTVDLQPTDVTMPAAYYTIRVEWLESAGGYVGLDLLDWPVHVPAYGGAIGDMITVESNPTLAWVGIDEPPQLPVRTVWWLQTNPDNPDDPRATGILYEWS